MSTIREKLIKNAIKNMKEFGYPYVDEKNILTDEVYSMFFKGMLEDNLGKGFDSDIKKLLEEITPKKKAKVKK